MAAHSTKALWHGSTLEHRAESERGRVHLEASPGRRSSRAVAFRLAIGRALGAVVVTVHGRLDATTAAVLDGNLRDLIDGQGNLFVVLDLEDATLGRSHLDVLVRAKRSLDERDGRFVLAKPSPESAEALRAAGLGDAVEVHPERRHHPTAGSRSQNTGSAGQEPDPLSVA